MKVLLLLAALLVTGCGDQVPSSALQADRCPQAENTDVAIPAPLIGKSSVPKVSALQIRVELAREKERAGRLAERRRGDACAAAFEALRRLKQ